MALAILDSFKYSDEHQALRLDAKQMVRWRALLEKQSSDAEVFVHIMALARRMASKRQESAAVQLLALAAIGIQADVILEQVSAAPEFSKNVKSLVKQAATGPKSLVDGLAGKSKSAVGVGLRSGHKTTRR